MLKRIAFAVFAEFLVTAHGEGNYPGGGGGGDVTTDGGGMTTSGGVYGGTYGGMNGGVVFASSEVSTSGAGVATARCSAAMGSGIVGAAAGCTIRSLRGRGRGD